MRKGFFAIIIGHILGLFYLVFNDKIEIELANFVITFFAFGAAIYAIYNQHKESKQAEENFKTEFAQAEKHFQEQFALQKEVALKQETIGAWQVLANKAPGNSGKKEAIEFLAGQGLRLCGIDMSSETHGGSVYLDGLFQDFKEEDRSKINLMGANFSGARLYAANFSGANLDRANFSGANLDRANFSGANLYGANFSGANLDMANFSGANLYGANFSGANLDRANFSGANLDRANFSRAFPCVANFSGANLDRANFSEANLLETNFSGANLGGANFLGANLGGANFLGTTIPYNNKGFDKAFIDCYCYFDDYALPEPPLGYKFEFEERTDENNQPIYPENNPNYRYIKLKIK